MEIRDLSKMQISLDEKNGFLVKFSSQQKKYDQITKDLVGLFGEIGEFSNLVKKINLKLEHGEKYVLNREKIEPLMREELADSLIYIIRIAAILEMDLETEVIKKIKKNEQRYQNLRDHE